jgi:hypothetical protein
MYRTVISVFALGALLPATALASTEPPGSDATESTAMQPAGGESTQAPAGAPATVYNEDGDPVASITAGDAQTAWTGYEEGNEPDEGQEYLRLTVTVESLVSEDTFGVSVGDFILQNNQGFITEAQSVRSAEEAEGDVDLTEDAELANGESVELTLTFPVDANAGPRSVFYRPDELRLIGVADVSQPSPGA